jgi:hypothetical protein
MAGQRLICAAVIVASTLKLAGCQSAAEQRAAFEAAIRDSCRSQGFAEETDAFRMCLLLERTNARLGILESRLDQLEFAIRRLDTFRFDCVRCR